MTYKTFFTVLLPQPDTEGEPVLRERVSYLDIGESLTVERVSARLDGKDLGYMQMAMAFPDALAAARKHKAMLKDAAINVANNHGVVKGPFNIVTPSMPADLELLDWWHNKYGARESHVAKGADAPAQGGGVESNSEVAQNPARGDAHVGALGRLPAAVSRRVRKARAA